MKDLIKTIIREFHTEELPPLIERDMRVPFNSGKIITLVGPRRSGKTYMMYQLIKNLLGKGVPKEKILYINFEDERIDFNSKILDLILQSYRELYPEFDLKECYFFFDEVQNAEGWERFIRRVYDRVTRNIFITGSNSRLLSEEIATSLRGRTLKYEVLPLNFKEFIRFKGFDFDPAKDFYSPKKKALLIKYFEEYMTFGGFPEIPFLQRELKVKTLQEYFEVMIYRDLAERYSIRDTFLLKYFLKRLVHNTCRVISVNKIYNELKSQGLSVGKDTLYRFLEYAQNIYFIRLLKKHYRSLVKTEFAEKKLYLIDTGYITSLRFLRKEGKGTLLENVIFKELINNSENISFFKERKECDFILDGKIAVQVSYDLSDDHTLKREIEGLKEACRYFGLKECFIVTFDEERTIELNSTLLIKIIPAYRFVFEI